MEINTFYAPPWRSILFSSCPFATEVSWLGYHGTCAWRGIRMLRTHFLFIIILRGATSFDEGVNPSGHWCHEVTCHILIVGFHIRMHSTWRTNRPTGLFWFGCQSFFQFYGIHFRPSEASSLGELYGREYYLLESAAGITRCGVEIFTKWPWGAATYRQKMELKPEN